MSWEDDWSRWARRWLSNKDRSWKATAVIRRYFQTHNITRLPRTYSSQAARASVTAAQWWKMPKTSEEMAAWWSALAMERAAVAFVPLSIMNDIDIDVLSIAKKVIS